MHRLRTFLLAFLCLVIPAVAAVTPLTYHPVARFDYEAYGAITFVRRPGDPVHYGFSTQGGNDGIGSFFRMEEKGGVLPLFSFPLGIVGRPTGPVAVDANGDIYGLALSEKQYPTATDETKLYKLTVDGTLTVLHSLTALEGNNPVGMLLGTDGNFYGVTQRGGASGFGTFFQFTPGGQFSVLHNYAYAEGVDLGPVIEASDGNFYGMGLGQIGSANLGMIHRITKAGAFSVLYSLDGGQGAGTLGGAPHGALVEGGDGALYGTLTYAGPNLYGSLFRVTKGGVGSVFYPLDGAISGYNRSFLPASGTLLLGGDSNFYGITNSGGVTGYGTLFRLKQDGTFTVLRNLTATESGALGLAEGENGAILWSSAAGGPGKIYQLTTVGVFSTLTRFTNRLYSSDITQEFSAGVIGDGRGHFYGTLRSAGRGSGLVFRASSDGTREILHTFDGSNGATPSAALCLASDGNLYGTTIAGGPANAGTLFRLTPAGTHTLLHSFSGADGSAPRGRLIQAGDAHFYGTTSAGGVSGAGTVFRYTIAGQFSVLHEFNGPDGRSPIAGLTEGADGALYGTTESGGPIRADQYGNGVIFRMTKAGLVSLLYAFNPQLKKIDGFAPRAELLHAGGGVFYGTTSSSSDNFQIFPVNQSPGTVFRISSKGVYTRIASLSSLKAQGVSLHCESGLVKGADGAFYGTTGNREYTAGTTGLAFRVDSTGNLTSLFHFTGAAGGTLWRGDAGELWGSVNGPPSIGNLGDVFVLSPGLAGAKGNYTALVSDAGGTHAASGRVSVTLGATGSFTGRLEFAGTSYSLSGRFDALGDVTRTIPRGLIASPLVLALHLNVDDPLVNRITGTLTAGGNNLAVELSRAPSFALGPPAEAGKFTIRISPPRTAGQPGGDGYASLIIAANGAVTYAGILPDLAPFTGRSFLRTDGTVPLYAGIYAAKARGSVRGDLAFREIASVSDADATLCWDKPPQSSGLYSSGFSTTVALAASRFVTPPKFTRILPYSDATPNARLERSLGLLTASTPFTLLLNNTTLFTNPPASRPTLRFDKATGFFSGAFPEAGKPRKFAGTVFQKTATATGLLTDGTATFLIGIAAEP